MICIQNGIVALADRTVRRGTVILEGRKIAYAGEPKNTPRGAEELDARGGVVCPSLIDIHFHGAGEHSLDPPDEGSFRAIAATLANNGIGMYLPGMMPSETLVSGLSDLVESCRLTRRIPGLYVEGPFVNTAKRGGIQEQYILPVSLKTLARFQRLARGRIALMTFAPELDGAEALPAAMANLRIVPCVGHTLASAQRAASVIGRRKAGMTHLWNAMSGVDHRNPGVALFGLTDPNIYVELNADGTHVAADVVRLTYKAKNPDRIVLISDAVISAGGPEGEYGYMGTTVVADAKGVYYRDNGTLVGSRRLLNESLGRFIHAARAPLHEAVRMATLNPARLLGLARRKGSLEAGKDADVAVFSRDFRRARAVFFEGEPLAVSAAS